MQAAFPEKPARRKRLACCGSRPPPSRRGRRSFEDEEAVRLAHQEANLRPLPEGWQRVRSSETGEIYFLNTVTHRRVAEFPTQAAAHRDSGGKATVKTLSRDIRHLKVQVDDLYRQLSTQHHRQIEQWAARYRRRGALRMKRRIVAAWSVSILLLLLHGD